MLGEIPIYITISVVVFYMLMGVISGVFVITEDVEDSRRVCKHLSDHMKIRVGFPLFVAVMIVTLMLFWLPILLYCIWSFTMTTKRDTL